MKKIVFVLVATFALALAVSSCASSGVECPAYSQAEVSVADVA